MEWYLRPHLYSANDHCGQRRSRSTALEVNKLAVRHPPSTLTSVRPRELIYLPPGRTEVGGEVNALYQVGSCPAFSQFHA